MKNHNNILNILLGDNLKKKAANLLAFTVIFKSSLLSMGCPGPKPTQPSLSPSTNTDVCAQPETEVKMKQFESGQLKLFSFVGSGVQIGLNTREGEYILGASTGGLGMTSEELGVEIYDDNGNVVPAKANFYDSTSALYIDGLDVAKKYKVVVWLKCDKTKEISAEIAATSEEKSSETPSKVEVQKEIERIVKFYIDKDDWELSPKYYPTKFLLKDKKIEGLKKTDRFLVVLRESHNYETIKKEWDAAKAKGENYFIKNMDQLNIVELTTSDGKISGEVKIVSGTPKKDEVQRNTTTSAFFVILNEKGQLVSLSENIDRFEHKDVDNTSSSSSSIYSGDSSNNPTPTPSPSSNPGENPLPIFEKSNSVDGNTLHVTFSFASLDDAKKVHNIKTVVDMDGESDMTHNWDLGTINSTSLMTTINGLPWDRSGDAKTTITFTDGRTTIINTNGFKTGVIPGGNEGGGETPVDENVQKTKAVKLVGSFQGGSVHVGINSYTNTETGKTFTPITRLFLNEKDSNTVRLNWEIDFDNVLLNADTDLIAQFGNKEFKNRNNIDIPLSELTVGTATSIKFFIEYKGQRTQISVENTGVVRE